jgi:hypothetical protein
MGILGYTWITDYIAYNPSKGFVNIFTDDGFLRYMQNAMELNSRMRVGYMQHGNAAISTFGSFATLNRFNDIMDYPDTFVPIAIHGYQNAEHIVAVNKDTEHKEEIMWLFYQLLTDTKLADALVYGVEGMDYRYNERYGNRVELLSNGNVHMGSVAQSRYTTIPAMTGILRNTTPVIYQDEDYHERLNSHINDLSIPNNLGFRFIPDVELISKMDALWVVVSETFYGIYTQTVILDDDGRFVDVEYERTYPLFPNLLEGKAEWDGSYDLIHDEESGMYWDRLGISEDFCWVDVIDVLNYHLEVIGINELLDAMNLQYNEWLNNSINRRSNGRHRSA